MRTLRQSWWAPLAAVLAISQLGVALAFIFGDGTSNLLDWESAGAGVSLSLVGATTIAVGLSVRPHKRGIGNALIMAGAALAAIWIWIIFMGPLAIGVIVGVVVSEVRSVSSAAVEPRSPG